MQKRLEALHKSLYSEKSKQYMFLALCTTVFVYGFMYRIIELRLIFWCALPFIVYEVFNDVRENPIDISFIILSVFGLLLAMVAYIREPWLNTYWSDVKVAWVFPTAYMLGRVSVGNDSKMADKRIFYILTALNFGMFFQAVLDHINQYFRPLYDDSAWYSFWKDDYEVRTVFAFGFIIMASVLYDAFKRRRNKFYFWSIIISSVACIFFSITTEGRTTLVLFITSFVLFAIIDFLSNYSKKSFGKKNIILLLGIIIVVAIILIMIIYATNMFEIRKMYNNSFLSRDGGIIHNVRIQANIDGIKQLILYPEGGWYGSESLPGGGTHNTWLEFARYYNTVIFFILLLYVLITIKNIIVVLAKKNYSDTAKYFLCSITLSLFCYMCLEPVGAIPAYYYVVFFIFVSGIMNKCAQLEK